MKRSGIYPAFSLTFVLLRACVADWSIGSEVDEVRLLQSDLQLQTRDGVMGIGTFQHFSAQRVSTRSANSIKFISLETRDNRTFIPMLGVPGRISLNLGAGKDWQGWDWRLDQYISFLETEVETNPAGLVVVTDAGDVAVGGCTDEILVQTYRDAIFAGANKSDQPLVVFGATHAWMPKPALREDDYGMFVTRQDLAFKNINVRRNAYQGFVNDTQYSSKFGALSYLNFGMSVGPVGALLDVFKGISAVRGSPAQGYDPRYSDSLEEDARNHTLEWNDQQAAHEYLLSNPQKVTLDYTGRLFLNMGGLLNLSNILSATNGTLQNLVTGTTQCFGHFQGSAKPALDAVLTEMGYPLQSV